MSDELKNDEAPYLRLYDSDNTLTERWSLVLDEVNGYTHSYDFYGYHPNWYMRAHLWLQGYRREDLDEPPKRT